MNLRSPALHFLLLGAGLYWLFGERVGDLGQATASNRIVLSASELESWENEYHRQLGNWPTAEARARHRDELIDDEVLYREALKLHIDEESPIVRDRLARLAGFVEEIPGEDAAELEHAARSLGLQKKDLVIRRHLIRAMKLTLERAIGAEPVSEETLRAYFEERANDYRQAPQVRLSHVYWRGADAHTRAVSARAKIIEDSIPAIDAANLGDPFLRGAIIGPISSAEIERIFGAAFGAQVGTLSPGEWSQPVESVYGTHLVRVEEAIGVETPSFETVRNQVTHRYLAERRRSRLRARLDELRRGYTLEGLSQGSLPPGRSASGMN